MSTTPQLIFQVRPESYGALTIEALQSRGQQPPVPPSVQGDDNLDPPIPQPVFDQQQARVDIGDGSPAAVKQAIASATQARFSKAWIHWLWKLSRAVGGSTPSATPSGGLQILAPSVDETDIDWYGSGTISSSTDPVSFTATLTRGSRFGIQVLITAAGTTYATSPTITISSSNGQGRAEVGTGTVAGGKVTGYTRTTAGYNLAAPLTVAITGGGGSGATATAKLGRQWAVGDFIIWNNPTIVSSAYSYEIDQITGITPINATSATFTLARRANGAVAGSAQYGSLMNAQSSIRFHRLINKEFDVTLDVSSGPQVLRLPWDNMAVGAVKIAGAGITPITLNLAPLPYLPGGTTPDPRNTPPCPGLRTMSGAAYKTMGLNGDLTVGFTSANRIAGVDGLGIENVRCWYAKVRTAPTGATSFQGNASAAIVIYVCYINPSGVVGLLDTLVIDATKFISYSATNAPDGRQMPFHVYWPKTSPNVDWPPNVLPSISSGLDASGNLVSPIVIASATTVLFVPDGDIDFMIAQVGTTIPGADILVTGQT